jgi:GNAT superfamily N-acetyltransferase
MASAIEIRFVTADDFNFWLPLWAGYNEFYRRTGPTAISDHTTSTTWSRLLDKNEPMFALVAEQKGQLVGFVHYLFHRSTSLIALNCYLQDLYTLENLRGQGIGRKLIEAVYREAKLAGSPRVYWQTHETNTAAMKLYDKIADRSDFLVYSKKL